MRLSDDVPARLCRCLFTLLMMLAWCGAPQARAQETAVPAAATDPATGPQAADPTPEQLKAAADGLARTIDELQSVDRELTRQTFDSGAVVKAVGNDPQKLLSWVKENTRWVPYRGTLRGATGVLMDRLGNSLDRSLLLAELLQKSGQSVRLAHAQLSEPAARKLRSEVMSQAPIPEAPANAAGGEGDLDALARERGQDPDQLRRDVEKTSNVIDRIGEEVAQSVADQLPVVTAALQQAPATTRPDTVQGEVESLQDHWWVQRRDGESWTDFDPMMPHTEGPLPATQTVDFDAAKGSFQLDPQIYHQVRVRVVAEQWAAGKLSESTLLDTSIRTSQTIGRKVMLSNLSPDFPDSLDLLGAADPAGTFRTAVLAEHEWVPMLIVGDQTITQEGVTDAGKVDPKPQLDALGKAGKAVSNSTGKVIDALNGIADDVKPAAEGVFTAEWVEFTPVSPARMGRSERREVFDLIGAAARSGPIVAAPPVDDTQRYVRGLGLLGTIDLLPFGCQFSSEFVVHRSIASLIENRAAITELLRGGGSDTKKASEQLAKLSPPPAALYEWALGRAAWSRQRSAVFIDQPNLVCLRREIRIGDGNQPVAREVIDIVANSVGIRPGAAVDERMARLEQGVVDTSVEAMVPRSASRSVSMVKVAKLAAAAGVKWLTVRPGAENAVPAATNIPLRTRPRIARDLSSGFAVVLPETAEKLSGRTTYAWWRIDPATGECLGMTDDGGASMVEYASILSFGLATGFWTYAGCGGFAKGASGKKKLGCAACAAVMAAVAMIALAFAAGIGGASAAAGGKALGSVAGTSAVGIGGMGCNALSALAS